MGDKPKPGSWMDGLKKAGTKENDYILSSQIITLFEIRCGFTISVTIKPEYCHTYSEWMNVYCLKFITGQPWSTFSFLYWLPYVPILCGRSISVDIRWCSVDEKIIYVCSQFTLCLLHRANNSCWRNSRATKWENRKWFVAISQKRIIWLAGWLAATFVVVSKGSEVADSSSSVKWNGFKKHEFTKQNGSSISCDINGCLRHSSRQQHPVFVKSRTEIIAL